MVRKKKQAARSKAVEPMEVPTYSSDSSEKPSPAPIDAKPSGPAAQATSDQSSPESELPPLSTIRAPDQHPITSFFTRSPAKSEKGKQVLMEEEEVEVEIAETTKSVSKKKKLPVRKSPRAQSTNQTTPVEKPQVPVTSAKASSAHAEQLPEQADRIMTKKPQKVASASRKRKSEVEQLDTTTPVTPRTRQRRAQQSSPPAAMPEQPSMGQAHQ